MTVETVLVVCTGNICRSPVGEALLAHQLAPVDIIVSSAGTRAMEGSPPAPETLDYIQNALGIDAQGEGTQLTKEAAGAADLILAMTEDQRAWVTRLAPRTVRRTYTMLEFSRVLAELDQRASYRTLSELVRACAPQRRKANSLGAINDIADPYGRPPEVYATSFAEVEQASREIATVISDSLLGANR